MAPVEKEHEDKDPLDSDNEDEDVDDLAEQLEKVEIDPSKLTPLSPEVISKQVCTKLFCPFVLLNSL